MTSKRKENPQKELSKEWIVNALLKLMDEKDYKQITITAISKKADLSRRTFYRHFSTVDSVLDFHIKKMSKELAQIYAKGIEQQMNFYEAVTIFFSFWEQHRKFLELLKKNQLLSLILLNFMPSVRENVPKSYLNDVSSDYLFSFTFGGICSLLVKWIEDGAKLSTEEIGELAKMISKHYNM